MQLLLLGSVLWVSLGPGIGYAGAFVLRFAGRYHCQFVAVQRLSVHRMHVVLSDVSRPAAGCACSVLMR